MRILFSILVFINSILPAQAQKSPDAQSIINNYLASVKAEAVQTGFSLKMIPKNAVNSQSVSGTITMKGNRFYLTMDDVMVWYDGTTQWAYFKHNNEVTITKPTAEELAETNPMAVLAGYSAKSKVSFSKEKRSGYQLIDLTPSGKKETFSKVSVLFVNNGQQLSTIKVFNNDGSRNELTLQNYKANVKVANSAFVFDATKHPGVVVNDLR